MTRLHALVVLLVGAALLAIDVLRAPKRPEGAAAAGVAHVDDNGQHDDEDACDHGALDDGDAALDDDDRQGATDDDGAAR